MTSFNDAPLESLLDPPLDKMSPQELAEYVKACAVQRSSAQTRKATLRKESDASTGKSRKKDPVAQAQELLNSILNQLPK